VSDEAIGRMREEHEQSHASHLHTPDTGQIAVVARPMGDKAIAHPTTCINNACKAELKDRKNFPFGYAKMRPSMLQYQF
jgi:hypothetical protein